MMESMESYVPPGFRFHPTDEELVGYYLRKKVASQKIDLDVIRDIDLYRIEPWDLQERCRIGYEEQNEWYFFSHKDKKYPTGTRTNRATMAGFWKATGRDKAIYDKSKLIGMRKTLEEGWVVCRAFKKRTSGQSKSIEGWDSSYFYDEPSGVSSVVDPTEYMSRQPQGFLAQNLLCKQETEADNLSFMQSDQYLQLPQLESPSLPLLKRPISSISLTSENNNEELLVEDQQQQQQQNGGRNRNKKVTDWRALDKFVASQLSQDPDRSCEDDSSFGAHDHNSSDISLLLLQDW
ncbi:hypothetical protein JRO89_XS08G0134000 [Xanthoceras sorbifolium]|uniref:NAC domain-containing protein n=1 Tax=Xanthoceras sorbifolium TaxID=99658 RepID=A0ABQ8HPL3_9ROSI|nr:hypothetical protein JRO89_XS08G0134000 [Xanthoceras sorbifolium]